MEDIRGCISWHAQQVAWELVAVEGKHSYTRLVMLSCLLREMSEPTEEEERTPAVAE